jgi:hypothetical protein
MQILGKFIQWLLVGLSVFWLIVTAAIGNFLSAILMVVAIISLAPPTKKFLAPKLPNFINTVFVQFLIWIACWLTALHISASIASQSGYISPRESVELFNSQIEQYISIPDLKEAPSSNAQIDGKVLVILRNSSALSGEPINMTSLQFMSFVPKTLRATQPNEVEYIVWLDCDRDLVGRYTNGARAYQQVCSVSVIDRASNTVIARSEEFRGSDPPHMTKSSTFSSGDLPEEEMQAFLASLIQSP